MRLVSLNVAHAANNVCDLRYSKVVAEFWDKSKGVRGNMQQMGLVADANNVLAVPNSAVALGIVPPAPEPGTSKSARKKKKNPKPDADGDVPMTEVVRRLEEEANRERPKNFRFGPELSKFIVYCMEKYGDDYEV